MICCTGFSLAFDSSGRICPSYRPIATRSSQGVRDPVTSQARPVDQHKYEVRGCSVYHRWEFIRTDTVAMCQFGTPYAEYSVFGSRIS
jgi:hypothetical protein